MALVFNSKSSMAQMPLETRIKPDSANKVQFIGAEENVLIFDLRFTEIPVKGCSLRIIDDSGNPIFEELITGNSYSRRYKVVRDNMTRISFKAIGKGFTFNQSFNLIIEERLTVIAD